MVDTIGMDAFAAKHADGAYVIDVREPAEYVGGHVPGAKLVPMSRIGTMAGSLPRDRDVYVICQSGNRSKSMADFLAKTGVRAISVNGGTAAWSVSRRPLVEGMREA